MNRSVVPVTVAIATLDRPEGLARCVDALLGGSVVPDEILIVDQGVAWPEDAVVAGWRERHPNIRRIQQPRLGLSASRNVALLQARNSTVAVTDDDCVPAVGWVEALMAAFERGPEPVAVAGRVLSMPGDEAGTYAVSLRTDTAPADYTAVRIPWGIGTGANFAVRRVAALGMGGYDERLGAGSPGQAAEDCEMLLCLLQAGARIRYDPDAVVYHERQSVERRMATRWSYAYGIGALIGLYGRQHDPIALRMSARWMRGAAVRLVRAVLALNWSRTQQALLSLGGTVCGMAYGWRAAGRPRGRGASASDLGSDYAIRLQPRNS
jgi:GT2 family glycosyltransferase